MKVLVVASPMVATASPTITPRDASPWAFSLLSDARDESDERTIRARRQTTRPFLEDGLEEDLRIP